MARSACTWAVVVTLAELLPAAGSTEVAVSDAVLVSTGPWARPVWSLTVARMRTAEPAGRSPSEQGKPPAHGAVAETKVVPDGAGSARTTAVAVPGPRLRTSRL